MPMLIKGPAFDSPGVPVRPSDFPRLDPPSNHFQLEEFSTTSGAPVCAETSSKMKIVVSAPASSHPLTKAELQKLCVAVPSLDLHAMLNCTSAEVVGDRVRYVCEAVPCPATFQFRDRGPTVEEIRAHEARGGVWKIKNGTFRAYWHQAGYLNGWNLYSASERRGKDDGTGWEVKASYAPEMKDLAPCTLSGKPCNWPVVESVSTQAATAQAAQKTEASVIKNAAKPTSTDGCEFRESPVKSGRLDLIEAHRRLHGGRWEFERKIESLPHWLTIQNNKVYCRYKEDQPDDADFKSVSQLNSAEDNQRPVLADGTPVAWDVLERAKVVNVNDTVVPMREFSREKDGVFWNGWMSEPSLDKSEYTFSDKPAFKISVDKASGISDAAPTEAIAKQITKHPDKELTTMPEMKPAVDTFTSRFVAALKEGAKRAPVEAGVDKGHEMLKELLVAAGNPESPREEGIIREYVTRLLASNYGKAIGAYGISEMLHMAAPHLGKRADLARAAGREFANRAATVAEKEAGSNLLSLFPKGIKLLNELLDSFAEDTTVEPVAHLTGSSGDMSRIIMDAELKQDMRAKS